jgi:hypothetical protein
MTKREAAAIAKELTEQLKEVIQNQRQTVADPNCELAATWRNQEQQLREQLEPLKKKLKYRSKIPVPMLRMWYKMKKIPLIVFKHRWQRAIRGYSFLDLYGPYFSFLEIMPRPVERFQTKIARMRSRTVCL